MSKQLFTKQQIKELSENKYVLRVSDKSITYSDDFKAHAIAETKLGKISTVIFEEAGFDMSYMSDRAKQSISRWKSSYNKHGELGLRDTRKTNSGRTLERELSVEEQLARKDAKIAYLEAELEFVKKLDMIERMSINKGKK